MTMNTQTKLMLLCLFVSTAIAGTNVPARDYTMINFDTGLTTTILEVGTTSFTFVVEWSPDVSIPRTLTLMGRLLPETRGWSSLEELELDKANSAVAHLDDWYSRFPVEFDITRRKATFEIPYRVIPWYHMEPENLKFAQRAFFSVQWPVESEEEWWNVYGSEENEKFGVTAYELGIVKKMENQKQEQELDEEQTPISNDKTLKIVVTEDEQDNSMASSPNRLWLYAGIVLLLSAVFYFVRRKTRN